jgi:hypothetical protein
MMAYKQKSFNVQKYGAIADGKSHPLRERFSTVEAAREVYPSAVSLDDETDWAALKSAFAGVQYGSCRCAPDRAGR